MAEQQEVWYKQQGDYSENLTCNVNFKAAREAGSKLARSVFSVRCPREFRTSRISRIANARSVLPTLFVSVDCGATLRSAIGAMMLSVVDFSRVKRLLCLGSHCDDIEVGAGGTLLHLFKEHPELQVR